MAIDADSGKTLWKEEYKRVLPLTLAVDQDRVYFHDQEMLIALERDSGRSAWKSTPLAAGKVVNQQIFFAPTLIVKKGVILFAPGHKRWGLKRADGGVVDDQLFAYSAENGKLLWQVDHPTSGYASPEDLFVFDDTVSYWDRLSRDFYNVELKTGKLIDKFNPYDKDAYWFHHRCHKAKATKNYVITSINGTELVDREKKTASVANWVRGTCLYGLVPANGLIYEPPSPCSCLSQTKLTGFVALAPASSSHVLPKDAPSIKLKKGPAWGKPISVKTDINNWPAYRNDNMRSGFTKQTISPKLKQLFKVKAGTKLSRLTVGAKNVFVSDIESHTISAINADTGVVTWTYTAGSRVDSPPTLSQGRVVFGCNDGYVYCLRADDGSLIWRYQAALTDRRHMNFQGLESVWPVHGSVLIIDENVYCVAGRSMFTDGGMLFLKLDLKTGEKIFENLMDDILPETGKELQLSKGFTAHVARKDILSYNGKYIYMRTQPFDLDGKRIIKPVTKWNGKPESLRQDADADPKEAGVHLFSPTGFLDDTWFHRTYWVFGNKWISGAIQYFRTGQANPAGRILVFDDKKVYGYGRKPKHFQWITPMEYSLFKMDKRPGIADASKFDINNPKRPHLQSKTIRDWEQDIPFYSRALLLADKTIFAAGPSDIIDEDKAVLEVSKPEIQEKLKEQEALIYDAKSSHLLAVSAVNGKILEKYKLTSIPIVDGMVGAYGRIYIANTDGTIVCFDGTDSGTPD